MGFYTSLRSIFPPSTIYPVSRIINLAFFQLVWIVTIIGVDLNLVWPGLMMLCVFFIVNAIFLTEANGPLVKTDLILVVLAAMMGLVIDTLFIQSGVLSFKINRPWAGIAPLWILILWANFALILNHGLRWMQGRHLAAAILGFFGGPASYLVGIRLGAGELNVAPLTAFMIIGLCWAAVTPLLLTTARELTKRIQIS